MWRRAMQPKLVPTELVLVNPSRRLVRVHPVPEDGRAEWEARRDWAWRRGGDGGAGDLATRRGHDQTSQTEVLKFTNLDDAECT